MQDSKRAAEYATHTVHKARALHTKYDKAIEKLGRTHSVSIAWRLCLKIEALAVACRQADRNAQHAARLVVSLAQA